MLAVTSSRTVAQEISVPRFWDPKRRPEWPNLGRMTTIRFLTESRHFGEGIGIAVKKGNDTLVRALNRALYRLWERGVFTDLYLRYFPVGFY